MSEPQSRLYYNKITIRICLAVIGLLILALVYIFQRFNFLQSLFDLLKIPPQSVHPYSFFIVNKTARLVLNDLACFMIIFAIFQKKKYMRMAWYFFLFEIVVLLPLYFA